MFTANWVLKTPDMGHKMIHKGSLLFSSISFYCLMFSPGFHESAISRKFTLFSLAMPLPIIIIIITFTF